MPGLVVCVINPPRPPNSAFVAKILCYLLGEDYELSLGKALGNIVRALPVSCPELSPTIATQFERRQGDDSALIEQLMSLALLPFFNQRIPSGFMHMGAEGFTK